MQARLQEVRDRASKITPAPWHLVNGNEIHDRETKFNDNGGRIGETPNLVAIEKFPNGSANADFIANSPADIQFLLDALEQAQKETRITKLRHNISRKEYLNVSEMNIKRINIIYDLEQELKQSQDRERVLREALELLVAFDKSIEGTERLDLWQVTQQARQALGQEDAL